MIDELIDHLIDGTNAQHDGLLESLASTDQGFIVTNVLQLSGPPATVHGVRAFDYFLMEKMSIHTVSMMKANPQKNNWR